MRLKCIHGDYLKKLRTALENSIFCTLNYISYVILKVQELLALANAVCLPLLLFPKRAAA